MGYYRAERANSSTMAFLLLDISGLSNTLVGFLDQPLEDHVLLHTPYNLNVYKLHTVDSIPIYPTCSRRAAANLE